MLRSEPAGTRERAKSERRGRIVAAAAELIRSDGLAGATVRHIAEVADVSPATIYNLIGSRDDVFDALFDEIVGALDTSPPPVDVVDPLSWIADMTAVAAGLVVEHAALLRPLMAERPVAIALRDGPRLRWARIEYERHLREAARRGVIPDRVDAERIAQLLVDVFIANYARWAMAELDDDAFVDRARADTELTLTLVRGTAT